MKLERRIEKIKRQDIKILKELEPRYDRVFSYLLERAVDGQLLVYFAAIPPALIRPFDPDLDPRKHPVGRAAIDMVIADWRAGQFGHMWVYELGEGYIMSDNYITWFAVLEGKPDYVPCWVLGKPTLDAIRDVQGPLDLEGVRELLGFGD